MNAAVGLYVEYRAYRLEPRISDLYGGLPGAPPAEPSTMNDHKHRTPPSDGKRHAELLTTTEARAGFSETINRVAYGGQRFVIERRGQAMAALVSMEELAILEKLEDLADIQAAEVALAEPGESIPWDRIKEELGI